MSNFLTAIPICFFGSSDFQLSPSSRSKVTRNRNSLLLADNFNFITLKSLFRIRSISEEIRCTATQEGRNPRTSLLRMTDRISSLPDSVISQGILSRLELNDAVRTSVLSRSWRYKWTLIPDLNFSAILGWDRKVENPSEYLSLLNSILLQHVGPLNSVKLVFPPLEFPIGAFDTAIQVVLGRGVRALNVWDSDYSPVSLPYYFPTCPSLESLYAYRCRFSPPSEFAGFPNLKSLVLSSTQCSANRLSEFINSCTKLEELVLQHLDYLDASRLRIRAPNLRHFKLRDAKFLQLLEIPSVVELNICLASPANSGKFVLSCCLAQLECLKLGGGVLKSLSADGIPRELSSRLPELKTLTAYQIDIHDLNVLSCLLSLVTSSHRLRRLNIFLLKKANVPGNFGPELAKHADCCFSYLTHVKISYISGSKAELKLIEFLLAHSPVLEELSFRYVRNIQVYEELMIYRELIRFRRVSPNAEIKYLHDWTDIDTEEVYSQPNTNN